jgi:hypothetical protein
MPKHTSKQTGNKIDNCKVLQKEGLLGLAISSKSSNNEDIKANWWALQNWIEIATEGSRCYDCRGWWQWDDEKAEFRPS